MSNDKSTPKWGVHTGRSGTIYVMDNKALETVAEVSDTWGKGMTNSELIVSAVNSHEALVEALEEALKCLTNTYVGGYMKNMADVESRRRWFMDKAQPASEQIRAALALAKGE